MPLAGVLIHTTLSPYIFITLSPECIFLPLYVGNVYLMCSLQIYIYNLDFDNIGWETES